MADNLKIISPYDDYTPAELMQADGVYGNNLLSSVQSLQVGFGSKVLRVDRDGLWMGAETFASAPFSVGMDGIMTATSLDLSGYLEVGGSLADIQALIGDIGDISSDLGTISAGSLVGVTVTGGTVQTSSTGGRVVMSGADDALYVYDATAKRMALDGDSIEFYNSSGTKTASMSATASYALEIDSTGSAYLGVIFNASYGVYFDSGGSDPVCLISDAGLTMQGSKVLSTAELTVTNDIQLSDNLYMNNTSAQIIYMDNGNIQGIRFIDFAGYTSNPSSDGMLLYYDNAGTQGLRMQMGGVDYQFDAAYA